MYVVEDDTEVEKLRIIILNIENISHIQSMGYSNSNVKCETKCIRQS